MLINLATTCTYPIIASEINVSMDVFECAYSYTASFFRGNRKAYAKKHSESM